jgi:hypothetical protein
MGIKVKNKCQSERQIFLRDKKRGRKYECLM